MGAEDESTFGDGIEYDLGGGGGRDGMGAEKELPSWDGERANPDTARGRAEKPGEMGENRGDGRIQKERKGVPG